MTLRRIDSATSILYCRLCYNSLNEFKGGLLKKKDIISLIRDNVRNLHPYQVKSYPCKIKLDANESPYSPFLIQHPELNIENILQGLNRYPDPEARQLRGAVSKIFRARVDNILHGNGSDELIYYLITTFGGPVLCPAPTFSMYGVIAQALGEKKIEIPLDDNFDLDTDGIIKAVKRHRPRLIFLSSPNNPTGNTFSTERIMEIVKATARSSLVVIDEAYQPFSNKGSLIQLFKSHKNVAVMRTLSKMGLAALRVGFIIADADVIREINKVRLPFNLNSLSQAVALAAMNNKDIIRSNIRRIVFERRRLFEEMKKIKGIHPYPSDANFILFKVRRANALFNELIKRNILIRNMDDVIKGCLRVTVGTPHENTLFLNALRDLSGTGG